MSARRGGSKHARGGAGKPEHRPAPPHEGTLPVEDVELPPDRAYDVHDAPAPPAPPRGRVIHERRPSPRVPAEDEAEPRAPE